MPLELRIMPLESEEALIQKLARVNYTLTTFVRGKWTSEFLEEAMEVVEQGTCYLWGG